MPKVWYEGPLSDHFDGELFFDPRLPARPGRRFGMLRWMLRRRPNTWPDHVDVTPARPQARVERLRVTHVGHASSLIQVAGRNLLTDPVWSERASPVRFAGPRRVAAPGIAWADLPPIDAVLVSHGHYDHLDLATLRRLHERDAPLMVAPLGNDAIIRAAIPGARTAAIDWWERVSLGEGWGATTLTPAHHWSSRTTSDSRRSLWGGHFLEVAGERIWFAGDTGYGDGAIFREIRARLGAPGLALIPIGAYEPRDMMARVHVNPTEAVEILQDVEAGAALGIHWGTFRLTDEAWDSPRLDLARALDAASLPPARFVAAEPGQVYEVERAAVPVSAAAE